MFLRNPACLMLFLCSVISLGELEAKSLQKNQQVGISKYSVAKIQIFLHSRQFFFMET